MTAGYSKAFMPLDNVKEKEFMSRPLGCQGVGFSFVRYKAGYGAGYVHRHKVQEEVFIALKGEGTILLDGSGSRCPRERSSEWGRKSGGRSETTRKKMLCLWC